MWFVPVSIPEMIMFDFIAGLPSWVIALGALSVINLMGFYAVWPFIFAFITLFIHLISRKSFRPKHEEYAEVCTSTLYKVEDTFLGLMFAAFIGCCSYIVLKDASWGVKIFAQFEVIKAIWWILILIPFATRLSRNTMIKHCIKMQKSSGYRVFFIIRVILAIVLGIAFIMFGPQIIRDLANKR